jgi:hypothetical protein
MASTDDSKPANALTGDSGPGTGLKDLIPIPSTTHPVTDPDRKETANALANDTSLSHALATNVHDVQGAAQQDHEKEVLDLGWNERKQDIPQPLVGRMDNEELWLLIRRFNKVIINTITPGESDTVQQQAHWWNSSKCTTSRRSSIRYQAI